MYDCSSSAESMLSSTRLLWKWSSSPSSSSSCKHKELYDLNSITFFPSLRCSSVSYGVFCQSQTVNLTVGSLPVLPSVCPVSLGQAAVSPPGGEHWSPEAVVAAELASPASPPRSHSHLALYLRTEVAYGGPLAHKTLGCATFPALWRTQHGEGTSVKKK